ncbi:hypothetical protein LDL36_19935 [Komagataeibacter sp. FNDCR1]|nr:hypothetical protein [Komagataeibacter sp. FNDCR1]
MSIMAKYAQIFWPEPNDVDVGARNASVELLRGQFADLTPREAIKVAAHIADILSGSDLPADLSAQAEKAISDKSPAFVIAGKEQQGVVCLAVAALALARGEVEEGAGWTAADAMAAALWSALTLQDPLDHSLMEGLRKDLIAACRDRVRLVAKASRARKDVPDVGNLTISEDAPTGTRAQNAYKRATAPVIAALKDNADIDREELDFLWWVLGDYSEVLGCPLADREPMCRAVAAGIEGASMLRRLPSDGVRHAALRLIVQSDQKSLAELIEHLGDHRQALGKGFVDSWAKDIPTVFPLLTALASTEAATGSSVRLDARGWGSRAMLEASMVDIENRGSGVR